MTFGTFLDAAIIGLAALLLIMSAAISVRHVVRTVLSARRQRLTARFRPEVLDLLSEDSPDLSSLDHVDRREGKLLESLVWRLLPKVRGPSRAALVIWLERRGAVEKARRRTHHPGAVGRAIAAQRLGFAAVPSTVEDVARLLDDHCLEVRMVAASALGKFGEPRYVSRLLDLLDGSLAIPKGSVAIALIHTGPAAINELISGLTRPSAAARSLCLDLLGFHQATEARRQISALVQRDASDEVRVAAVAALGCVGSPDDIEVLARVLTPLEPLELRVAATHSVGQIGGDNALQALHIVVNDADPTLRSAAAKELAGLGEAGFEILALVFESDGVAAPQVRDQIARTIVEEGSLRQSVNDQSSDELQS